MYEAIKNTAVIAFLVQNFGFVVGLLLGFILGYIVRGLHSKHIQGGKKISRGEIVQIFGTFILISLWASAHVNNIYFGGAPVDNILNIVGGLAVASLVQEKESLINFVRALRGKDKEDTK